MIEIKHWLTGAVIYRSENADTVRAAILEAVKSGASLSGANLSGADLRDANLDGIKITGALSLTGLRWPVVIFFRVGACAVTQIGCERHEVSSWSGFDDEAIAAMASDALAFWREWRGPLLALAKYDATEKA